MKSLTFTQYGVSVVPSNSGPLRIESKLDTAELQNCEFSVPAMTMTWPS